MSYSHLAPEERYQIHALMKGGHFQSEIAAILGRHPATIGRELRRNRGRRSYRPAQAQGLAQARARASRTRPRITAQQWRGIAGLLTRDWSPQQIAARARRERSLVISPEWIYQFVYAGKAAGNELWRHLRGQKPYRKRYGSGRERRGQISGRRSIWERPASVEGRRRLGHWEADTLIGARRRAALLSVVERRSRYTRLGKLVRLSARATRRAFVSRLSAFSARVRSLTADNGKEFAEHRGIAKDLQADFYFADPYAAWQRGTNENTNGLVRQYLPKSRDLSTVSGAEIRMIENRLNYRPRKCLDYLTPYEVFNDTRFELTVALRG